MSQKIPEAITLALDSFVAEHGLDDGSGQYRGALKAAMMSKLLAIDSEQVAQAIEAIGNQTEAQLSLTQALDELRQSVLNTKHVPKLDQLAIPTFKEDGVSIGDFFVALSNPKPDPAAWSEKGADTQAIETIHRAFWHADKPSQLAFIQKLSANIPPANFRKIFEPLVETLLPPPNPAAERAHPGTTGYANGKLFAGHLLASIAPMEVPLHLLSVIRAIHYDKKYVESQDPQVHFGHRLSHYLVDVGATKAAQSAHSFFSTPDAWKEGLAECKSLASPMTRLDYLTMASTALPNDLYEAMHFGKSLGTGTYLDTLEVTLSVDFVAKAENRKTYVEAAKGKPVALQLVKPHSGDASAQIFTLLENAAQHLMGKSPEAKKSMGPLVPIIKQAASMIHEETNLQYATQKANAAVEIYDGKSVDVNDTNIVFDAVGVITSGKDYRLSKKAQGLHFNQLPEKTSDQKKIKQEIALGILAFEAVQILSGKRFDHDRHGDNQAIEILPSDRANKNTLVKVHIFDENAISLTPPTQAQMQMFANILMDAMANSMKNGYALTSSVKHTFARAREWHATNDPSKLPDLDYVDSMIKAVLSLGDYIGKFDGILEQPMLLSVIKVLQTDKGISQDVKDVIATRSKSIEQYVALKEGEPIPAALQAEHERHEKFYPKPTTEVEQKASGGLIKSWTNSFLTMVLGALQEKPKGWMQRITAAGADLALPKITIHGSGPRKA